MPHYLLQAAYTPEACAAMIKNPQSREKAIQPVIEKLGGKITALFFALGDYDTVALVEMPDNVSATAFSMAAAAAGGVKALKTTPLMTAEEGLAAMKKAADCGYRPPS